MSDTNKNVDSLVDQILQLSLQEVAKLVKSIEERTNISAVAIAAPGSGGIAASAEAEEEQDKSSVSIVYEGLENEKSKYAVIGAIRKHVEKLAPGTMTLMQAQKIVEAGAAVTLCEDVEWDKAKEIQKDCVSKGAKIALK